MNDVARVRDLFAEEDAHDAQLHFALGLAVDHGVAAGAEDPEEAVILGLEDAGVDEAAQGFLTELGGALGDALHPVAGVARLVGGDIGKGRVKEAVAERGGVDQDEVLEVGIDAVLQREVHEDGAGEGTVDGPVGNVNEGTVLVAEQEQDDLFDESQHRGLCFHASVMLHGSGKGPGRWCKRPNGAGMISP